MVLLISWSYGGPSFTEGQTHTELEDLCPAHTLFGSYLTFQMGLKASHYKKKVVWWSQRSGKPSKLSPFRLMKGDFLWIETHRSLIGDGKWTVLADHTKISNSVLGRCRGMTVHIAQTKCVACTVCSISRAPRARLTLVSILGTRSLAHWKCLMYKERTEEPVWTTSKSIQTTHFKKNCVLSRTDVIHIVLLEKYKYCTSF